MNGSTKQIAVLWCRLWRRWFCGLCRTWICWCKYDTHRDIEKVLVLMIVKSSKEWMMNFYNNLGRSWLSIFSYPPFAIGWPVAHYWFVSLYLRNSLCWCCGGFVGVVGCLRGDSVVARLHRVHFSAGLQVKRGLQPHSHASHRCPPLMCRATLMILFVVSIILLWRASLLELDEDGLVLQWIYYHFCHTDTSVFQ